jgi:hypothetical protein
MISVDGAAQSQEVRLPGRSMWKSPGLNHLTKLERDALVRSLRLSLTEQ